MTWPRCTRMTRDRLRITKRAAYWYLQSANRGVVAVAQFKLGGLYEKGLGVPQDYVEAYKWYAIAAGEDREDEYEQALQTDTVAMNAVAPKMTSSQKAEAKKRVHAFRLIPTDRTEPTPYEPGENCPSTGQWTWAK